MPSSSFYSTPPSTSSPPKLKPKIKFAKSKPKAMTEAEKKKLMKRFKKKK
tara:strand:+ start:256 stop:405 length:150 start_codon:yes stop_codon:yes gene_type:complete